MKSPCTIVTRIGEEYPHLVTENGQPKVAFNYMLVGCTKEESEAIETEIKEWLDAIREMLLKRLHP